MKIKIAENIRAFRKERKLTQEQLSEALGVTVGAVSKWESGASTPDISLIVEMADFFETSVDVLLGYGWEAGGMGEALKRMKALRNQKQFDEATTLAEKTLQKYPNAFEAVFQSAVFFSMKGVERRDLAAHRRALGLFERSLELIAQNKDEMINEWTIRNNIADTYLCLDQTQKALEIMKQNNADGLNNSDIGFTLAVSERKPDEALPYLSDALIRSVANLFRCAVAFSNAYSDKKDFDNAVGVLLWTRGVIAGLKLPGRVSYWDKSEAQLLTGCAMIAALRGDPEGARAYLTDARKCARRYDEAPSYDFANTRYYHSTQGSTAFDDFGTTALEGVRRKLEQDDKISETLIALWDELEQKDL